MTDVYPRKAEIFQKVKHRDCAVRYLSIALCRSVETI